MTASAIDHTLPERVRRLADQLQGGFLHLVVPSQPVAAMSYPDLVHLADRWRSLYAERGLQPRDSVVVILPHGLDLYTAYLGAFLGGLVPAYFAHPSPKFSQTEYFATLGRLMAVTGAKAVILYPELADQLAGHDLPGNPLRLVTERDALPTTLAPLPDSMPNPDDTAFIQFSSGTTGLKKGVEISHRALLWQVDTYARTIGLSPADRIATWLPLYHDMGLLTCWLMPLLHGVPLIALSPFDWVRKPGSLLRAIHAIQATLCWLPNFAYRFLADRVDATALDGISLASLRGIVNCSEPVLAASHQRFLERFAPHGVRPEALAVSYAMAENTFAVTSAGFGHGLVERDFDAVALMEAQRARPPEAGRPVRRLVSCGRPLPDTRLSIRDSAGTMLPDGQVGDVVIESPCLFTGYLHNLEKTAEVLRDGAFHTGDQGFVLDGEVYILGRAADTIIIAGKNLYPQDIEAIAGEVDGVVPGRLVAFGIPDESLGTEALVILAESREPLERHASLARAIHHAVASRTEAIPADVVIVEHMSLRKSTAGKISRQINRDRYLEQRAQADAAETATDPGTDPDADNTPSMRQQVRQCLLQVGDRAIMAKLLADLDDDAPLIGGGVIDSLGVVLLMEALAQALGKAVPADILQNPEAFDSITLLAERLSGQTNTAKALGSSENRRNTLAPHLLDTDRQPFEWLSYIMRRGAANYRSKSLNTDARGFRIGYLENNPFDIKAFSRMTGPRGVLLGNSGAFGVGISHDRQTITNQLNARRRPDQPIWYNMALRASSTTQDRLALELYGPGDVTHLAWMAGVNNLIGAVLGAGDPINPSPYVGEWSFLQMVKRAGKPRKVTEEHVLNQAVQSTVRDLDITSAWLQRRGGRMVFLLQPALAWINKPLSPEEQELVDLFDGSGAALRRAHHPDILSRWHGPFVQALSAACAEYGIDFIDLNVDPRLRTNEWLFIDRIHLTDRGQEILADIIEAWCRGTD